MQAAVQLPIVLTDTAHEAEWKAQFGVLTIPLPEQQQRMRPPRVLAAPAALWLTEQNALTEAAAISAAITGMQEAGGPDLVRRGKRAKRRFWHVAALRFSAV